MSMHPTLKRLLKAVASSALAGGIAYGLTAWLAPPSVSANWVAVIVTIIAALTVLAPTAILNAIGGTKADKSSNETYYDLDFSLKKNSGYED